MKKLLLFAFGLTLSAASYAQCFMSPPNITHVSCGGSNDGSIDINIPCPVTYTWHDGYTGSLPRTGLSAGTYTLTVTDNASGYQTVFNNIEVFNSAPVIINNISSSDLSCPINCDGSASVSATSNSPLTYAWNNGGNTSQINSICAVGTYHVTVSNASGCSQTAAVTINNAQAQSNTSHKNTVNQTGQNDEVKRIINDDDGNIYVLGEFTGESEIDGYPLYAGGNTIQQKGLFLVKYDACGDQLWVVHMENTSNSFYDIEAFDLIFSSLPNRILIMGKWDSSPAYSIKFISSNGSSIGFVGSSIQDVFAVDVNMSTGQINTTLRFPLDYQNKYTSAATGTAAAWLFGGQINGRAGIVSVNGSVSHMVVKDDHMGNIVSDFEVSDNGTVLYAAVNLTGTSAKLDGLNAISSTGDAIILKSHLNSSSWLPPTYIQPAYGSNVFINDIDISLDNYNLVTAVGSYRGATPNWSTPSTQISSNVETALIAQFNESNLSNSGTYHMDGNFTSAQATAVTTDDDNIVVTGVIRDGDWYSIEANGNQNSTSSVGSGPGVNTMWAAKFSSGPTQTTWLTGAVSTPKSMVVNDVVYDAGTDLFFVGGGYGDYVSFYPHSQLLFPSSTGSAQLGYVVRGVSSTAFFHKNALGNENDNTLSTLENKVTMYPNPNNGTFNLNIESETNGTLKIVIYNVSGTNVYSKEYNKSSHSFDQQLSIPGLTSGMYMMHLTINGTIQYQKFMIK